MKSSIKRFVVKLLTSMPYPIKYVVYTIWSITTKAGRIADRGVRFVVSSWEEVVRSGEFYHLYFGHHYWWASQNIPKGSRILDLGCGTGYGSWYLAHSGNYVLGVDVHEKTIEWAKKHFKDENLLFELRNPNDYNFGSSLYDYVVCFEVLEHLSEQSSFLQGIFEALKQNGKLIISTANAGENTVRAWLLNQRQATRNPGHVKELDLRKFESLLKEYFRQVTLYGHCLKGAKDFNSWQKWRYKNNVKLADFEMRKDFINCEVIVAVCEK